MKFNWKSSGTWPMWLFVFAAISLFFAMLMASIYIAVEVLQLVGHLGIEVPGEHRRTAVVIMSVFVFATFVRRLEHDR